MRTQGARQIRNRIDTAIAQENDLLVLFAQDHIQHYQRLQYTKKAGKMTTKKLFIDAGFENISLAQRNKLQ